MADSIEPKAKKDIENQKEKSQGEDNVKDKGQGEKKSRTDGLYIDRKRSSTIGAKLKNMKEDQKAKAAWDALEKQRAGQ